MLIRINGFLFIFRPCFRKYSTQPIAILHGYIWFVAMISNTFNSNIDSACRTAFAHSQAKSLFAAEMIPMLIHVHMYRL